MASIRGRLGPASGGSRLRDSGNAFPIDGSALASPINRGRQCRVHASVGAGPLHPQIHVMLNGGPDDEAGMSVEAQKAATEESRAATSAEGREGTAEFLVRRRSSGVQCAVR